MTNKSEISFFLAGHPIRAHGLGVVFEKTDDCERVRLSLTNAGAMCMAPVDFCLVKAQDSFRALTDPQAEILICYPGRARHPAGTEAGVSWINDLGEGWLRILRPDRSILLPLQGWDRPVAASAIVPRGRRGPPKSMDLWLAVAALLRPSGLDAGLLQDLTGINSFNIYDWIARATNAGWILRLDGWQGRRDHFVVPPAQIPVLGEYIRASWEDWRQGKTTKRLKPNVQYFVSTAEWPDWANAGMGDVIATGVTWLEGHEGGTPILSPEGSVPRLSFFCRAGAWDHLLATMRITTRGSRERPYDSQVLLLADDHPIWTLSNQAQMKPVRRVADGDVQHSAPLNTGITQFVYRDWPAGLRVLDAMNDPEPRVRDAAESVWAQWLTQHRQNRETQGIG
jgi:hypothetical protein